MDSLWDFLMPPSSAVGIMAHGDIFVQDWPKTLTQLWFRARKSLPASLRTSNAFSHFASFRNTNFFTTENKIEKTRQHVAFSHFNLICFEMWQIFLEWFTCLMWNSNVAFWRVFFRFCWHFQRIELNDANALLFLDTRVMPAFGDLLALRALL